MKKSWKDLTAEQYLKIQSAKDNAEILQIVFDEDLNKIPVRYFSGEGLEWLKELPKPTDVTTYYTSDTIYKLVKMDSLSMGEYIDLTSLAEKWEENIWKIMCIMYRPISGYNPKYSFKQWLGKRLIKAGGLLDNKRMVELGTTIFYNLDYEVQKYNPEEHFKNEQDFKDMPADLFYSFMLFFSLLLTKRTLDTLKSSNQTLEKMTNKTNP